MLPATALRALCVLALVSLGGCAHVVGHDFARPEQAGLVLGQSTEADILSRYGQPSSRGTVTRSSPPAATKPATPFDPAPVAGVFSSLRYAYVKNEAPIAGGDMNQKGAAFTLWNGVLVAEDFSSSFATDSSDFDEDTVLTFLAPGHMTRAAVIAQFGNPGGRRIYPMTLTPGTERLRYSYQKFDRSTRQRQVKTMDIMIDASGHVTEYRATSAANPFALPAAPSGGGGGVIFLPIARGGHR